MSHVKLGLHTLEALVMRSGKLLCQLVNSSPCLAKGIFVVLGSLSSTSEESSMSIRAQFWVIDLVLDPKGGSASFCQYVVEMSPHG